MRLKSSYLLSLAFLFLCISLPSTLADSAQCLDSLQGISANIKYIFSKDPTNITADTRNFLALSGRFINDFGEYETCQNATLTSHYLTLNFTADITSNGKVNKVPVVIGFCSPLSCSSEDALANLDMVYTIYSQGMSLPLKNLTDPDVPVAFYDPRKPQLAGTAGTVIILVILSLVTMLTLTGTGFGIYYEIRETAKVEKEKEEDEKLLRNGGDSTMRDISSDMRTSNSNLRSSVNNMNEKPKKGLRGIYKFLDCFDARKNFDRLVQVKYTDTYDYNLEIFNGIRVFMMLYVVYGHSFMFGTNYIDNLSDLQGYASDWWLLVLAAALYSVDVFFYMSGFLFAYIGLGKLKKMKPNPKNYVGLVLHRILRIWPTYALALLFFWRVLPLMGEGPIWFKMTYYTNLCNGTIWQNFLFLDDLFAKSADYCFGWGWYLSNDLQMFMITPIFLWLYIRKPKLAKLLMFVLIVISLILALVIGAELNVRATPPATGGVTNARNFALYYVKPYIRLPPYLIGVLAALIYKEYKEQQGSSYKIGKAIKSSRIAMNLIPLLGFALMLFLVLMPRPLQFNDQAWPDWVHYVWRAFQKSAYVIALTMVIMPILLGENTLLKRFLSHPILVPLARLGFSAYLVHLFWIYRNYFGMSFSFHFSYLNGTLNTLTNAVIAFAAGLILSLIAEVPMANIESTYISGRGRRPKVKPQANQEKKQLNNSDNSIIPIVSSAN